MFEKVNASHPDKQADRIAGAIVDMAYENNANPKIAVEVLLGHGTCHIIIETDTELSEGGIDNAVKRIAGNNVATDLKIVSQDRHLADNQKNGARCGDNGIFKGMPVTDEQRTLSQFAKDIYTAYPFDGKYVYDMDSDRLIICQSNAVNEELRDFARMLGFGNVVVNPLGEWTGGSDVDTGATNRKLGSDMADSVTGGGLHGKDASKADVSVNIHAFLKAQRTGKPVELYCAIGDDEVDGLSYEEIVIEALDYIRGIGGFEAFAEWGLV